MGSTSSRHKIQELGNPDLNQVREAILIYSSTSAQDNDIVLCGLCFLASGLPQHWLISAKADYKALDVVAVRTTAFDTHSMHEDKYWHADVVEDE